MRFLCLLLLTFNLAAAQTAVQLKDAEGKKLASVAILKIGTSNTLISITDSTGISNGDFEKQAKYLFHLLGFEDQILSGTEISRLREVSLNAVVNKISDVDVKKTNYKRITLLNKPGNFAIGESNSIKQLLERVTLVNFTNAGFLNSYTLFGFQKKPGTARIFRFVLYSSVNGIPGSALARLDEKGILNKGRMTFKLANQGIYLERGEYFIGYETSTSLEFSNSKTLQTPAGVRSSNDEPIFIKGKTSELPKAFVRYNLSKWTLMSSLVKEKNEYHEMAYQLELNAPIN